MCAELQKEENDLRGSHVTTTTTVDGEKVIGVSWKSKSEKGKKKIKTYWMGTFIASDYTMALAGAPAKKKRST